MTSTSVTSIDTPHGPTDVTVYGSGTRGVLLAHGAGAGQAHPWIVGLAERTADQGVTVATFDYAYMAAGRKAPDRLPKLLDVHGAVAEWFGVSVDSVKLAGKSMGGRVGGHLVAERGFPASRLVYLGYPLVALGKTEPRPTDHLIGLGLPQVFVSGDRDRLGPIDLVNEVVDSVPDGRLVVIETGDHSLKPLKASGRTLDDSLDIAASVLAEE